MPRTRFVLVSMLALALAAGGVVAAPQDPSASTSFDLDVNIKPLPESSDRYWCQVTLRDLGTGDVISAPEVHFLRGANARVQSEIAGTGHLAVLTLQVSDEGTFTYQLEVRDGDAVLSRQTATVAL